MAELLVFQTKREKLTKAEKQRRYREKRKLDDAREREYREKQRVRNAKRKKIGDGEETILERVK